jgi:NAD(P)-dependent dehydrogenase (short-subunit alcohol dehydrogenase family)
MRKDDSAPVTALITGANRGIGLELVRQYADAGWRVHACCREPARARDLESVIRSNDGRVTAHALDVTDASSRAALARALADEPVDLLFHNAGIYGPNGVGFGRNTGEEEWVEVMRVNAIAPLKLSELLVDNVAKSRRRVIAVMSSGMGSVGDNTSGGAYHYRSSKSALNSVAKSMAVDLAPRRIIVLVLCPGWVRTDMGGSKAPLPVERSVRGLRKVIEEATPADSGTFIRYEGTRVPW